MSEACLACSRPAAERYTIVFESGPLLRAEPVCEPCVADLRGTDGIEVLDPPVLVRGRGGGGGGKSRVKECPECGREVPIRHWPRHLGTCNGDSDRHI